MTIARLGHAVRVEHLDRLAILFNAVAAFVLMLTFVIAVGQELSGVEAGTRGPSVEPGVAPVVVPAAAPAP